MFWQQAIKNRLYNFEVSDIFYLAANASCVGLTCYPTKKLLKKSLKISIKKVKFKKINKII